MKETDLIAECFQHLEQIFVGLRDLPAEQLEDSLDLSVHAEWEGEGTAQPCFYSSCGSGEIIVACDVADPRRLVGGDHAPG